MFSYEINNLGFPIVGKTRNYRQIVHINNKSSACGQTSPKDAPIPISVSIWSKFSNIKLKPPQSKTNLTFKASNLSSACNL